MIEVIPVCMSAMDTPITNKKAVLEYMKNGKHPIAAPMYYKDRETGKPAIEAYYLSDGVYTWSSDTIYHFEKYNYPLPEEFIKYVTDKTV